MKPSLGRIVLVGLADKTIRPAIVYGCDPDRMTVFAEHFGPPVPDEHESRPWYVAKHRVCADIQFDATATGEPAVGHWCWPPRV